MTDKEKKTYNKEHYKKNRPVILERVKVRYKTQKKPSENVISLFGDRKPKDTQTTTQEKPPVPPTRPSRPILRSVRLGTLFLYCLAAANTYFLISEMARFYASVEGSGSGIPVEAYLKALLLEGAVLSLCLMIKTKAVIGTILHGLLIILIYSYSIWAISNLAIQSAFTTKAQVVLSQKRVVELETEVTKKTTLRDTYYQANRITLGSRMDQQLQELKQSLDKTRQLLAQSPAVEMIWNTLISVILFRVLVMLSHLICLRELGRRYRLKPKTV